MFSFRRKPQQPAPEPAIRTSPSLPELSAQGIPWPSNLVDLSQLPPAVEQPASPPRGAAKTSFSADVRGGHVPFHKPWSSPGKAADAPAGPPIASLYASHPPSAFEGRKASLGARQRPSQKRNRNPTTFNLMVAGAQGTGKTSLLRLILDTADISPTATADQKAAMDRFLRGPPKRTDAIQTACVEICESKYDRLLLSVIDTPGLDFQEGHELKLERQVSTVVKYLDAQFADTLSEESKVVRQSKGDQHIHLCIYMIDPASIITESARRAQSSFPTKVRSETTISYKPTDAPVGAGEGDDASEDEEDDENDDTKLAMSPVDLRVIRRIALRANVLPVVAHADSLTDDKLAALKRVVRRDLRAARLDFGVFGPTEEDAAAVAAEEARGRETNTNGNSHASESSNGDATPTAHPAPANGSSTNGHAEEPSASTSSSASVSTGDAGGSGSGADSPEPEPEAATRAARPVIKLRATRLVRRPSRSRSRFESDLLLGDDDPAAAARELASDTASVASVRFSAHIVARTDLASVLPFALVTPEHVRRRRALKGAVASPQSAPAAANGAEKEREKEKDAQAHAALRETMVTPSEDGHASVAHSTFSTATSPTSPMTPASAYPYPYPYPGGHARPFPYLHGPPADLRGVFVRRFRWGTVDVLDPAHCDFSALRTAVLSTHIKLLKVRTKEVLYERYRTEKLLARRATRNISEDETKRLLEDLGL